MPSIESIDTYDAISYEDPKIFLGEKPDPVQMESDIKKPLAERVVADLTEAKKTRYTLDKCVIVETYPDIFREIMAQAWQAVAQKFTLMSGVVLVAAIGACIPSILPLRILAAGVCVAWFMYASPRISHAREQAQAYSTSPYQKPAEQRAQAYLKPFLAYYFSQEATKGVLHPNEVEYLYKKYLTDFCEKLLQEKPSTEQEKKAWMESFFTLNPLAPTMIQSGWKKIPSSFEELSQEYSQLFSAPISYDMLRTKFQTVPWRFGPIGPFGHTGIYHKSPYLHNFEGRVEYYREQFDSLKNSYLNKKEDLKALYGGRLRELSSTASSLDLQKLNDKFDYFLKQSKDVYINQARDLKNAYLEELQKLKDKFPPQEFKGLDEHFEKSWNELQAVFIEDKNSITQDDQYEKARSLLEKVLAKIDESAKKIPDRSFLDFPERRMDYVTLVL